MNKDKIRSRHRSEKTAKPKRGKGEVQGQLLLSEFFNLDLAIAPEPEEPERTELYMPAPATQSISTTNKVSDIIHNLLFPTNESAIGISQSATAKANIDLSKIVLGRNFGEFERAVLEGVFAQILAGNAQCMTPAMIYRAMTGKKAQSTVSEEMIEVIDRTITNCMYSPCVVCIADESGRECLDTNILHMRRRRRNVAGHMTVTYEVISMPIILELCMKTDALTLTPMRFLSAPIVMNRRGVAILNALQRYTSPYIWSASGDSMLVEDGVGVTPKPIVILYEMLYQIAWESDGNDRAEREPGDYPWSLTDRVRKNVASILEYWRSSAFILAWSNQTRGKKIVSVLIEFRPIESRYFPLRDFSALTCCEKRTFSAQAES